MENPQEKVAAALKAHYQQLSEKNPRYSMRAFAKKLKVSIATLSGVMSMKLLISRDRLIEMIERAEMSEYESNRLLNLLGENVAFKKTLLSKEDEDLLSDWGYRAVLFSFDMDTEKPSVEVLAERLGLTAKQVEQKIQELLQRKFLEVDDKGEVFRPRQFWSTSDGDPNEFVRRTHESMLSLAKKALQEIPTTERDFTSLMFAGSRQQLEEVRKEIRNFYNKIMLIMDEPSHDQLYQMSINLYPVDFRRSPRKEMS